MHFRNEHEVGRLPCKKSFRPRPHHASATAHLTKFSLTPAEKNFPSLRSGLFGFAGGHGLGLTAGLAQSGEFSLMYYGA